jgi:hypothetical protein
MYTINVKTEVLPLLVIIGFPYGKLIKTMMFNIQQLFAEGEVITGEYSPRRSRDEYSP